MHFGTPAPATSSPTLQPLPLGSTKKPPLLSKSPAAPPSPTAAPSPSTARSPAAVPKQPLLPQKVQRFVADVGRVMGRLQPSGHSTAGVQDGWGPEGRGPRVQAGGLPRAWHGAAAAAAAAWQRSQCVPLYTQVALPASLQGVASASGGWCRLVVGCAPGVCPFGRRVHVAVWGQDFSVGSTRCPACVCLPHVAAHSAAQVQRRGMKLLSLYACAWWAAHQGSEVLTANCQVPSRGRKCKMQSNHQGSKMPRFRGPVRAAYWWLGAPLSPLQPPRAGCAKPRCVACRGRTKDPQSIHGRG